MTEHASTGPRRLRRWMDAVGAADVALLATARRNHTPLLDRTLPALSNSADHSRLWLGTAAALWASGNRRLRRAGQRGLMSIALASFVTNAILKPLLPRPRPTQPVERWFPFVRLPSSSSFPSGHAASAAAFATAVAIEAPAVGVPVGLLAAGVASSRVYTGVHFPSDVVVGAAIGMGTAALSTRVWSTIDHRPAAPGPSPTHDGCDLRTGEGLVVVVNGAAGPSAHDAALEAIAEGLADAQIIVVDDPESLTETMEQAAARAATLGVLGGDGTINNAARIAHERDIPLAVFPGGTLNHFARDLGVDTIDAAVAAVATGTVAEVDVATIDDRLFLNTASFGAYADFVVARERLEDRIGKWPASLVALAKVLRAVRPTSILIDGTRASVWMAFIGNCAYDPPGFAPATRADLCDGLLDVRFVVDSGRWSRARFVIAMATGRLEHTDTYRRTTSEAMSIDASPAAPRLAADGEAFEGASRFTVTKSMRRLRVHAPLS